MNHTSAAFTLTCTGAKFRHSDSLLVSALRKRRTSATNFSEQGATRLNDVFDYPTLRGYDSDDPDVYADVGRGGVVIDTINDMRVLFEGIPIDKVSVSLVTYQPICNILVQSMYFANARRRGLPLDALTGTSQNDFLMETAITTTPGVLPPQASFKLSCDAIEFCTKCVPRWNPIASLAINYREAGSTAPQEVAFVISCAIACCKEMLRRGLTIDSFASKLSFFLSAHNDVFEEIAKYRAARRVYYKIMKERFKTTNPRSQMFRFHVQTAGVALTAQQPLNNIARAAYHAPSAVLVESSRYMSMPMTRRYALRPKCLHLLRSVPSRYCRWKQASPTRWIL